MAWINIISRVLNLAQSATKLADAAAGDRLARRKRLAAYATAVADTLQRTAEAMECLNDTHTGPAQKTASPTVNRANRHAPATRTISRELGRIRGYTEDLLLALGPHLDANKIRSVKRRLDALRELDLGKLTDGPKANQTTKVLEAEGYFRSLADRLTAG